MPIGIHLKEKLFTKQEFQLEKSDTIYLFTDGYIDQFSGKTNEKFKKTRFIELLKKINHLPLSAQKTIITEEYLTWKANFQQVDDILVMGVRI